MSRTDMPTAVLFRFPFPGPWGKDLAESAHGPALDVAKQAGPVWKIWLEDRETGHAGGIYPFEDTAAARYREKHGRGLLAMGLTGVRADTLSDNTDLSVLTMAGAAPGEAGLSQSASRAAAAASSRQQLSSRRGQRRSSLVQSKE